MCIFIALRNKLEQPLPKPLRLLRSVERKRCVKILAITVLLALLWLGTMPLAKGNAKFQLEISNHIFFPFKSRALRLRNTNPDHQIGSEVLDNFFPEQLSSQ